MHMFLHSHPKTRGLSYFDPKMYRQLIAKIDNFLTFMIFIFVQMYRNVNLCVIVSFFKKKKPPDTIKYQVAGVPQL